MLCFIILINSLYLQQALSGDLVIELKTTCQNQGQNKIAIILPKNRDTAIFNRLYIRLYIKFVANNGKNRDSAYAAISFCPWSELKIIFSRIYYYYICIFCLL